MTKRIGIATVAFLAAAAAWAGDPRQAWHDLMAPTTASAPAATSSPASSPALKPVSPTASKPASAPSASDERARIDAVLATVGNDLSKVRELIASDDVYEAYRPGWRRRTVQVADGETKYDVEYFVRIPKGYTPKKSWPLVISAHGQFGSGEDAAMLAREILGGEANDYIIVAPSMPGEKNFNARPYQIQAHLLPLEWARQNLNVDDDRIYVTGYSQGGHVSWHLAVMYGHLLAAAAPMAGVPAFEAPPLTSDMYLENLSSVPVWAIWGEKDSAAPPARGNVDLCRAAVERLKALDNKLFKGTEIPGAGHGESFPKEGETVAYFDALKRNPMPAKFTHLFHAPWQARGYYLEAVKLGRPWLDLGKPITVELTAVFKPTDDQVMKLMRQKLERAMFHMSAELDKKNNTLAIQVNGIRTTRVYVLDGMFNLAQPVTITMGGKTWKGKVPASPRCVLTNYLKTRDATCLVLNELDVDISGAVEVRFPEK